MCFDFLTLHCISQYLWGKEDMAYMGIEEPKLVVENAFQLTTCMIWMAS
jgi:hypothetical protein